TNPAPPIPLVFISSRVSPFTTYRASFSLVPLRENSVRSGLVTRPSSAPTAHGSTSPPGPIPPERGHRKSSPPTPAPTPGRLACEQQIVAHRSTDTPPSPGQSGTVRPGRTDRLGGGSRVVRRT